MKYYLIRLMISDNKRENGLTGGTMSVMRNIDFFMLF